MSSNGTEVTQLLQLSDTDREKYLQLRRAFSSSACRNQRNSRGRTFERLLTLVRDFVFSSPHGKTKRSLACGIFWLPDGTIAINTKNLGILMDRCKSSLNGLFKSIGYLPVPNNKDAVRDFVESHKDLGISFADLRKWSIRGRASDIARQEVAEPPEIVTGSRIGADSDLFSLDEDALFCPEGYFV